jgi:hypothetical protein
MSLPVLGHAVRSKPPAESLRGNTAPFPASTQECFAYQYRYAGGVSFTSLRYLLYRRGQHRVERFGCRRL